MKIPHAPAIFYQSQPVMTNCSPFPDKHRGVGCPTFQGHDVVRTPRQRPQETRSSSPVRSLLFCLLVSSFVFFCQVFVLLRVCSELFRKDPLRILVLVPPCTPLHPSGHLRCRSLPSSTGPRSVTRVFRPVSGAVLTGQYLDRQYLLLDNI